MNHNYKINGFGKTTKTADDDIKRKRDGLVSEFKDAKVSTNLNVVKSLYRGTYDLKGECSARACTTHTEIESREGWELIEQKAKKQLIDVNAYDTRFQVEQYLELAQTQLEALEPKRPPAERTIKSESCLDSLEF